MNDLDGAAMRGRVALVTGASRGIGAAIARRFAAAGAAVAVTARTLEESKSALPGSLRATVDAIEGDGGRAFPVAADLSRREERARLVEATVRELGPIDVLVNNAAVTFHDPVETMPAKRFDLMFELQVQAPFELTQLVLPSMRRRRRGWILNLSSKAALHPEGPPYPPGMSNRSNTVYGMCKAAFERFTTGLAAEVHASGIAVNALSPTGVVLTPGVLHHFDESMVPADRREDVELVVEAAYVLCTGDPALRTGRHVLSRDLLAELAEEPTSH